MAIIVKTPVTSNGRDPILNNGTITYKETIMEDAAREIVEKQNKFRPTHLKKIIESYSPNADVKVSKPTDNKPKNDSNK